MSPVGEGTEETWQALCEGRNGIGPITLFDSEGFACRMAGEVKGFDPLNYVDKKDLKKMGRFIFFAIAGFRVRASSFGSFHNP